MAKLPVVKPRAVLSLLAVLALTACGINPVTGERELQFISQQQELDIGQRHYQPTQQSQGGDFSVLPELSAYVDQVGQKLAAVADRELPYEFVVLDNPVPNAWALPGGKIAINRGLLTELNNEAELAAVLAHEIVHAAARHGAKAQERGTLLQVGLSLATIGAVVSDVDQNVAGLLLQGAGVGAQMVQSRYSREQELDSDRYGMEYMQRAGYDPMAAVSLQETFVRLSQQSDRQPGWFEGLFASHPPSEERVARNRQTASELGTGGELGAERYQAQLAPLRQLEPAFSRHQQALAALQKQQFDEAQRLAGKAVELYPAAGRFHQTLGDIALAREQPRQALPHYRQAMRLNPGYFGSYLGAGIAQLQAGGDDNSAEQWLRRSMELLPTAPAAYHLGNTSRGQGNTAAAMQFYQAAAGSDSEYGRLAAAQLVRLDLPQNPGRHIATGVQLDTGGRVRLVVQNRTTLALTDIVITPLMVDDRGRVIRRAAPVRIPELAPGQRIAGDAGLGAMSASQAQALRFRVESANIRNSYD